MQSIRITPNLDLIVPGAVHPIEASQAFALARDLLRHGARAIVLEEARRDRPVMRRKPTDEARPRRTGGRR